MRRVSGPAERLRLWILQGRIRPGEVLVQRALVSALGTTEGSLREALRLLEGRGLLVSDDADGLRVVTLDARDVAEGLRARGALEALAAGTAAERCHDGRLPGARVRELLDDAPRASEAEADRRFHLGLDALADNRQAHEALFGLWDRLLLADRHGAEATSWSPGAHAALVEAIVAGDPAAAARLAWEHASALRAGPLELPGR